MVETIFTTLSRIGLTSAEAQIYVFLAQNGPQKQKDIQNQLQIVPREATISLSELERKGFISIIEVRDHIFSIIPFEVVLERIIDNKKKEIQELTSNTDKSTFI